MRLANPAASGSSTPEIGTVTRVVLCLLSMILAVAPVSEALAAGAPSDAAVISLKKRTNKDCSVDRYRTVFRGAVPGADVPVTIATFAVEGCGGGSNSSENFGVFSGQDGSVVEWPQSPTPGGRVSSVELSGARLLVHWMAFRPPDPMCCPSAPHLTVYKLDGGKVVRSH